MSDSRARILDHACRLAVDRGAIPSLNELARESGLSKGGLIHHFPHRDALLEAIAARGIESVDAALERARNDGDLVRTWLTLSFPDDDEIALFRALASVFFAGRGRTDGVQRLIGEANARWELLLEAELGSARAASIARLLGDGLLLGAISGSLSTSEAEQAIAEAVDAVRAIAAGAP
ncbi:helix-turn-helix domain containing protein [Microcella daejeonensis]|uniref:TetR/AcrR family transcriptional regulator n=1 Tax=Microcella daejeonensis TaxID=2994971 RepID=UPI00226F95A3|nr:TetR/AcrR family transcriptional regulator [Microcella daejeonensis]WAB84638.1 helix-turn-helix domain containing protein [Microcella daejeonensis]